MYRDLRLARVPELERDAAQRALDVARDPDRREDDRIASVHRLRGASATDRSAIARALVPILNEPLAWLGSEAHACIWALDHEVVVGVDGGGSLTVCDEPSDAL